MVAQSHAKPLALLLTRPEVQGADFANALARRFGSQLHLIKTPLLAPRFYAPPLPAGPFAALILTSKTGVTAYLRLGDVTKDLPKDAYCVGESTATAAREAGLNAVRVAPDAKDLIREIIAQTPAGRLLHLRGRDARGDVAENLKNAGIDTNTAVLYAQEEHPLTDQATAVLRLKSPVLVPLFSPRTASIFSSEVARVRGVSPLFIIAMSGEIALEAARLSTQIKVTARPDATAMLATLALILADMQRA